MMNNSLNSMVGVLSLLGLLAGAALAILKVHADGEPGAIPLLLIIAGTAGLVATRRSRNRMRNGTGDIK